MDYQELVDHLANIKKETIEKYSAILHSYNQIIDTLGTLGEKVFASVFQKDIVWEAQINNLNKSFTPLDLASRTDYRVPDKNTVLLFALINNVYAVQNSILDKVQDLTLEKIREAQNTDAAILRFVDAIYSQHLDTIAGSEKRSFALSLKKNIHDTMEQIVVPFWTILQHVITDAIRLRLKGVLHENPRTVFFHKEGPDQFKSFLGALLDELGLSRDDELIGRVAEDYEKSNNRLIDEIIASYQDKKKPDHSTGKINRLRSTLGRLLGQTKNIRNIQEFTTELRRSFAYKSLFTRFIQFFLNLFSADSGKTQGEDILITYTSRQGRIVRRMVYLREVERNLEGLAGSIERTKESLESGLFTLQEYEQILKLQKIIQTVVDNLSQVYDQCNGLREWIGGKYYVARLTRIPVKTQEDLNDALTAMNYALILTKQELADYYERYKQDGDSQAAAQEG